MTMEQIESTELATLREKARLYDEALEQEPVAEIRERDRFLVNGEEVVGKEICWANTRHGLELTTGTKLYTKPIPQPLDTARSGVPEGWRLVPTAPTPDMQNAGASARLHGEASAGIYLAMLATSPEYKP